MLTTLAISGYRSLRNLVVPLKGLNLVTGANGSGKSNLYRALRLLADTAQGNVVQSLAQEGGLPSVLWAGPEQIAASVKRGEYAIEGTTRKRRTSLKLGFGGDEFGYLIDLGLPKPTESMFALDPEIKRECIWHGAQLRPSTLLVDRHGPVVRIRREKDWDAATNNLAKFDSVVASLADPRNAPEVLTLRESIRAWRFYDHFRADAEAPARSPQIGTRTPVLDNDGRDLAAALQTIREHADDDEVLAATIDDAFPRSKIWIENTSGRFALQDAAARPAAAARRRRAVGRHPAVPALGGGAADPAAAGADGAQRAGDEPAPGPSARARPPHRTRGRTLAGDCGVTRSATNRGVVSAAGVSCHTTGEGVWGDGRRRR